MSFSITVPPEYGYVILSCTVGTFVTNLIMGGPVMTARDRCNVRYPNMYATPGYHSKADEFNRVQRGHQNMFESLTFTTTSVLIGGLLHPWFCFGCSIMYHVGNILYQVGYSNTKLSVETARYQHGGMLKHLGYLGALGATIKFAGIMLDWW